MNDRASGWLVLCLVGLILCMVGASACAPGQSPHDGVDAGTVADTVIEFVRHVLFIDHRLFIRFTNRLLTLHGHAPRMKLQGMTNVE